MGRIESINKDFYGLSKVPEWDKFRSFDDLVSHNRKCLDALSRISLEVRTLPVGP